MPSKDNAKYAPKAWASPEFEFTLPSGDVCLLRKIDPLTLAEHGLMDKLDFATSVVMNTHAKNADMTPVERVKRDRARREGKAYEADAKTLAEIAKDAQNSKAFREVMDLLLVLGVAAPEMHLPPAEEGEGRRDDWFYTDAVPFSDKMAVFNKLMEGVRSVEQFREGSEEAVGNVAPESGVRPAAKRAPRTTRKRSAS
jgi:hypothetical protein